MFFYFTGQPKWPFIGEYFILYSYVEKLLHSLVEDKFSFYVIDGLCKFDYWKLIFTYT